MQCVPVKGFGSAVRYNIYTIYPFLFTQLTRSFFEAHIV